MRNLQWTDLGKAFRVESCGTREILLLPNVSGKVSGDLRAQAKGTRDPNRVFQLPLASRAQATELYICKAQQFRDTPSVDGYGERSRLRHVCGRGRTCPQDHPLWDNVLLLQRNVPS